jgi:adenine deaminase
MDKALTRIALVLAASGLLGLLAEQSKSGEPRPKQEKHGSKQPRPVSQPGVDAQQPIATLFKNARVFDGKSDKVTASTSVLVIGNKIEKIGDGTAAPETATVIDAGGRTLMPGLIDAHWHAMLVRPSPAEAVTWRSATATWWQAPRLRTR